MGDIGGQADLGQRLRLVRPGHAEGAALELHVLHCRFHQMGGDLLSFGDDLVHRLVHGASTNGKAATAIGAHAEGHLGGVAMHDIHIGHGDAQLVGDQLREGRLMALPMGMRAGQHRDAAGRVHADRANLIQAGTGAERADHGRGGDAAGLQIGGDADAAQLAARLGLGATRLEAMPAGGFQRL